MRFEVQVETSPRAGLADPEGATIERSLPALGFEGFSDVRVGKSMRFTIEADSADEARTRVEEVCATFLTNPVIEDSRVTVTEPAGASS
jgi:phosphoribosylformylglycinamidine synthase subunit PurS